MNITLGKQITIEVTAVPANAPAQKTLMRLLRKDPARVRAQRVQKTKRPSQEFWRRGNKMWHHQMESKPPFTLKTGITGALRATVDVVRDLKSVEQYIKVG